MNIPFHFDNRLVLRTPRYPLTTNVSLETLLNDTTFLEAIYLASPVLYKQCIKWKAGEIHAAKDVEKLKRSVTKYHLRMSSRCTPFGLFSGCTVVNWNEGTTQLTVDSKKVHRHTRLDMHYLCALSQQLALRPGIRQHLLYFPNSSVYTMGDELRYVEYVYNNGRRIHQISAVNASVYLDKVVSAAYNGATIGQLCEWIAGDTITMQDAMLFIDDLIEAQILVSELEPAITGKEFLQQLIETLERITSSEILHILRAVEHQLTLIDTCEGNDSSHYEQIMTLLDELGVAYDESKLFQTDIIRRATGNIDQCLQTQLAAALTVMNKLSASKPSADLTNFARRFYERYEDKEMPLLEVLDTESGIGYGDMQAGGITPLVDDLPVNTTPKAQQYTWGPLEQLLHRKLMEMFATGKHTVELSEQDVKDFTASWDELPASFSVMFRVLNDTQLYLESAGGSSAANLLSRFAYADPAIEKLVADVTNKEQALDQDVIYAEIIHLPESRIGNILLHPVFRQYEIPYLAKSSLDKEQQIDLQDLYLSVRNGRVILRSRRLGRQIIPRLSTAHNFHYNALPVYRFLCDLQLQDKRGGLSFNWGGLRVQHQFLPRVTYQQTILHLATWTFKPEELVDINTFREQWGLPAQVILADSDNELLIDFNNPAMVQLLIETVKNRSSFVLREFIHDQHCITDENDRPYVNQLVAVLSKNTPSYQTSISDYSGHSLQRQFMPGSEWIYYKLYCGVKAADKILLQAVQPLTITLQENGLIDKWFFIRYNDPGFHIRLRFHVKDREKAGMVISQIAAMLQPFKTAGYLWKIQLDTYNRELERYGNNTMELAETLFCHDSAAFLKLLSNTEGDEREHLRWAWGMRAIHELLNCFEFSLAEKYSLLQQLRDAFTTEFKADKRLLSDKYRSNREVITMMMAQDGSHPLIHILHEKATAIMPVVTTIQTLQQAGKLEISLPQLLGSYIHMMINRITEADPRRQEMVLYDFLARYYQSALAMDSKKMNLQKTGVC